MIWLTWRQHRRQVMFVGFGLAVLAALVIPTGLAMRSTFDRLGLPACLRTLGNAQFVSADYSNACNDAARQFRSQYLTLSVVAILFVFLPLFVGLFLGAPLVAREVEHHTHRLVWTQGISRNQWALAKFGLVGGFSVVVAVGYGLGLSWWLAPLARAGNSRFDVFSFDVQGVAPVGYTVFGVALGIFVGTVWRKVLPAMAAVLVGFLGVRIAVTIFARPRYLPPLTLSFPIPGPNPGLNSANGDWVEALEIRDATGHTLMSNASVACTATEGPCTDISPGSYNWTLYQPGSRYWLFQGIETGIFVSIAALLLYFALRRIRVIA